MGVGAARHIPINVGVVPAIVIWYRPRILMGAAATGQCDTGLTAGLGRRGPRRFWTLAVLFTASVLLVNAIVGEKGLTDAARARTAFAAAAQDLARIKRENAALRDQIRRLRTDAATIEEAARGLGFVRRGEIVITIKDVR